MKITRSKITIFILLIILAGFLLASFTEIPRLKLNYFYYIIFISIILQFLLSIIFKLGKIVIFIIILLLIIALTNCYYHQYYNKNFPENMPFGSNINIEAEVIKPPEISIDQQKLTLLAKINNNNIKILAFLPLYPQYKYGDQLNVIGNLQKPFSKNYENYLNRYQITAIMNNPEKIKYISNNGNILYKLIFNIKNKFENTINSILPEPLAAFLAGLLLGSRRNIPDYLISALNITGTTHIIAISGYNITILIKIIYDFIKSYSLKLSFIITLIIIFLFVILTGASSSVVRAAIMGSIFLLARQVGRKEYSTITLLLVAVVMVIQNPLILKADIGFQLSFSAVIGLIYLQPLLEKIFSFWGKWAKFPIIFKESLTATLAAQIFTFPILIYYFGRISLIAPVANILVLPLIPITMAMGFIASLCGLFWLALGKVLALLAWLPLKYITSIIEILAKVPGSSFDISKWNFVFVIIFYIILTVLLINLSKYLNSKLRKTTF